jgi:Tol biopolymer transport system component
MQIWIMESDGSRQRQLTSEVDGVCQPAWSPDGKQILFTSPCPGKQDQYEGAKIYVMDADGKNITPLSVPPSPEGDFDPAWSPNGKMIAFTSLRNGRPQIFTFNLDDQSLTELSKTPYADSQPSWSSTGLQIAFIRTIVNKQVWVMSDKGQFPAAFSMSGNVNNSWPAWTPDGRSILYSQMQAKPGIPWLVGLRYEDRGTSREVRIPPKGQMDTGPINKVSISPDGSWVVYESWPDGVNHDIYLMGINGANRVRLTTDPAFDIDAAWRPTLPIEN